ncbi:hypothetical protein ACFYNW_36990 [Streptomyces virginiae]|uniref:hypothetical protein n=1 Tax=Streptomyces virginiae TaxID=1961 RepID=UPI0036E2843C
MGPARFTAAQASRWATGWAVHHYAAPWAVLPGPARPGPAAWTLLLAAVVVLAAPCARMAGPGFPPVGRAHTRSRCGACRGGLLPWLRARP